MNFKKTTDKYYPDFYIDESGFYSIGLDMQAYNGMKIQVMFRNSLNDKWLIIREYTSYKTGHIVSQLKQIFDKLNIINFKEKVSDGWEEIEMILPPVN